MKFGLELKSNFKQIDCVEPFCPVPDPIPNNMIWHSMGFKQFVSTNKQQWDLVLTFACTIQIEDIDLVNTDTIAEMYFDVTANDGILIYESQKLNRNRHKQHAQRMIASFRKVFGNEFQIKAGRSRDQRTVHYYKKNL